MLGVVEGLTEFLPVSSTGHLTVTEQLFNLKIDDKARHRVHRGDPVRGDHRRADLFPPRHLAADRGRLVWPSAIRPSAPDPAAREAGFVVIGTIPIAIVGIAAKHQIEGPLRNVGVIAGALIIWSAVLVVAERSAQPEPRRADAATYGRLVMGVMQCFALVPGVSRSGATISAGLLRGIDRVSATRLSFFLAIPALTAATVLELPKAFGRRRRRRQDAGRHRDRVRRRVRLGGLAAALRLRTQDQRVRARTGSSPES